VELTMSLKLDDLWCWDCNLSYVVHGVACLRHTPESQRAARDVRIQKAIADAQRDAASYAFAQRQRGQA
jgi:hypothetical protein